MNLENSLSSLWWKKVNFESCTEKHKNWRKALQQQFSMDISLSLIWHINDDEASAAEMPNACQTTKITLLLTWKCKIIVQIKPKHSLGFPSKMSTGRMLTSLTFFCFRKLRAVSMFWSMWNRNFPRSRGNFSFESSSSSVRRLWPSRKSSNKSVTWPPAFRRWLFIHLVNVFFCIASRSSGMWKLCH